MRGRILIVDDEPDLCQLMMADLTDRGFAARWSTSPDEAFASLAEEEVDVVVTDFRMCGMSGFQLCERIVANRPDIPVIVLTGYGSFDAAVAAIRAGAYDFITKPADPEVVAHCIERAVQHRSLREEVRNLRIAVDSTQRFEALLGSSPAMRRLFDLLGRVANAESTVMIHGESGTGKELVAKALHTSGRRSKAPFVAINCAAMPENLLESELFGHARGAFTDARSDRTGLLALAHGGTLFLDEVGDMPIGLQPKLLRALEERRVRKVGSNVEVPFDVRVVAATHRDLETAIEEGRFREDLFFRLNVITLRVPSLRERVGDVLLLAQHFLEHFAARADKAVKRISPPVAEKLVAYGWPGNVRELRNCIERSVAMARYEHLAVEDLPEKIRTYRASHLVVVTGDPAELVPMEEVERRYVLRVLEAVGGNRSEAARILGFDRKTLYRKLLRFGVGGGDDIDPS
jgi:two-component system, NtrC family, response regulator AtoC